MIFFKKIEFYNIRFKAYFIRNNLFKMSSKTKSNDKSKNMTVEDKYKGLNDIDHILLRPDMYIGTVDTNMVPMWILDEESEKFIFCNIGRICT